MTSQKDIEKLLKFQNIAVVGCSPEPTKPSHRVASYLQDAGYRIIPVNPKHDELLGERCYPELRSVPDDVDVVIVFRKPASVPEVVEQAIAKGVQGVWMPIGVDHPEAAEKARGEGITVVADECFMTQHLSRMGR